MIEVKKFMVVDGNDFFTMAEALAYEEKIIPHYRKHIRFKCIEPCENFTVGKEYPFDFKYVGLINIGLIVTTNDNGKEVSMGETWVDGVIKRRFEIIFD